MGWVNSGVDGGGRSLDDGGGDHGGGGSRSESVGQGVAACWAANGSNRGNNTGTERNGYWRVAGWLGDTWDNWGGLETCSAR